LPAGDYAHHEDLYTLLKHLSFRHATILGVSMGGSLTIDFALAYPQMAVGPGGDQHERAH
jgi:pimeloyl-ACP methyl ester carboxylesterase